MGNVTVMQNPECFEPLESLAVALMPSRDCRENLHGIRMADFSPNFGQPSGETSREYRAALRPSRIYESLIKEFQRRPAQININLLQSNSFAHRML